ncbi:hypothetical protein ACFPRL_10150 [Pseudoclavibacter helvolus]
MHVLFAVLVARARARDHLASSLRGGLSARARNRRRTCRGRHASAQSVPSLARRCPRK